MRLDKWLKVSRLINAAPCLPTKPGFCGDPVIAFAGVGSDSAALRRKRAARRWRAAPVRQKRSGKRKRMMRLDKWLKVSRLIKRRTSGQ